jgi:hypothetical protein
MRYEVQVDELIKAAQSVEYLVWVDIERIGKGYTELTNAASAEAAKTALKELKLSAADLEKKVREILYRWGAPDALILNLNKIALRISTVDALSGLYLNVQQFYLRFLHCKGQAAKVKNLTALYYLIRDLAECSIEMKSENYRREI